MRPGQLEGLTRDGKQLVVGTVGLRSPTRFAVIDTRNLRVRDRFEIPGSFAYDALSPDGRTLYLTQYVDRDNASRYVVRAYDLEHGRLLPGRIADKAQASWVMEGFATTRTASGDGRWVYTLFMRPGRLPVRARARHGSRRRALHRPAVDGRRPGAADEHAHDARGRREQARARLERAASRGSRSTRARGASTHPSDGSFPWRVTAVAIVAAFLVLAAVLVFGRRRVGTHAHEEALPQPL